VQLQSQQAVFTKIAFDLGLRILGWREVPADGTILGPAASSKEPTILQPFVVLRAHYGDGSTSNRGTFDARYFERQLYVLRKHATHTMFVFFPLICSRMQLKALVFCIYKDHWRRDSISAPYRPRTLSTRVNSLRLKFITTSTT
jgi:glutamate synthase (NADH)